MRIGLFLGGAGDIYGFNDLIDTIVQAERDGFESFWLPNLPTRNYDALTVMAAAGRETTRIGLASGVVPTYSRHPMAMAQQALTAQAASNGRLTLGIGLSHQPVIENVYGLSYDRPAKHMEEYLSVLYPLINDGKVNFSGEMFSVTGELDVPESSPCPIVIAALAPRMLRLAGEVADGTVTWMGGIKAIESHVVPRINASAKNAGRSDPRVCVGLPVMVTDDESQGREAAARTFERYGQLVNYRRLLDIEDVDGPSEVAIVGSEAEVERQLRQFADAGATEFIASLYPSDDKKTVARTRELLKGLVGKI